MKANEKFIELPELELFIQQLDVALRTNNSKFIRQLFEEMDSGYVPTSEVVD